MSCVTQAAQIDMLADILRDPCTIRLYTNTPVVEPTAADFTEVDGGGYAGKPMRAQAWDLSNAPEEAIYPKQTWTFTGPAGVVQGYYVTRNSDGRLRWYDELSGGPMRIGNDGDQISIVVTFSLVEEDDSEDPAMDSADSMGQGMIS